MTSWSTGTLQGHNSHLDILENRSTTNIQLRYLFDGLYSIVTPGLLLF